ncbi:TIGR01777 family oxidoreductase [Saliterribacillus persicus]|uniref:TIGR01777 family protein n=1 Tax=Saliterribacillus persicus TaxID=930114 RepID=A0A368XZ35_9BACI|nr:TIGR01777 family oxidoreductase [Saliterribacillus persicus]RCW73232.1 hypothetical protein DFR57_104230 [Saliterribacillus persicus]
MRKVVIAGSSGFIGRYLVNKYESLGYDVLTISRNEPSITWNHKEEIIAALENADLLINLAGKSVNCRYNEKNKHEILTSRTGTTKILGDAIKACQNPPELWINSSTATIYRHAEDRPMTEKDGEIGTGFSVDVGKKWEKAFFSFNLPNTRQIALRLAIVLGPNGGVMTPYKNLVKLGLGGKHGTGKQMFSWIHIEDLSRSIDFVHDRKNLEGVFNCSSPNPVTNQEFMRQLRDVMKKNYGLPANKWMLEAGAIALRTETELLLKSRWVVPERLIQVGFTFAFPTIRETFVDLTR